MAGLIEQIQGLGHRGANAGDDSDSSPLLKGLKRFGRGVLGVTPPTGATDGGSDAHANDNVDPAEAQEQAGSTADQPMESPVRLTPPQNPAIAQNPPSLAAQLGQSATDRLSQLEQKRTALNAAPTTKQRIFQSLAAALPTVAGAIGGGLYGAAGAAQGTSAGIEELQQRRALQNQQLNQQIEAERGRQEKATDLAAQLEEQRAKTTAENQRLSQELQNKKDIQDLKDTTIKEVQGLKGDIAKGAQSINLRKQGLKLDENGKQVPINPDEMSDKEKRQARTEELAQGLTQARTEAAAAQADLNKMKADPNSPIYKAAQDRLNVANGNLAMRQKEFEVHVFGTVGGQVPAGTQLTSGGAPVGTLFQQNVRPSAQELGRADLAASASDQINDMKDIIKKHPEVFGPAAGRKTEFEVWLGSEDPDAKRFATAQTIAADHMTGVFGARGGQIVKDMKAALAQFKDNPAAGQAALDQVQKAAGTLEKKGIRNVATGGPASPKVGDTKKFPSGKTGKWDGKGWVAQ